MGGIGIRLVRGASRHVKRRARERPFPTRGVDASQELGRDEEMGGLGEVRPEAREDRTNGTGVRHRLASSMTTAR
jgi:hypothetical protein